MTSVAERYPPIDPYEHGMLDVGDGNRVYWETCGNPAGKPAVILHGGPGSGCTPGSRQNFDPAAYRIVLLDQRNCGRSTPHASKPTTDLAHNTTPHLIADLERLREHLGIERWLVSGASWGATLAIAYAQTHPGRVTEMVLGAVTTTRQAEIDWLYGGVRRFFPAEWARFRAAAPALTGDIVEDYRRLLESPDAGVREQAAYDWCTWEDSLGSHEDDWTPMPRYDDQPFRLAFARIVTHYFAHGAWLSEEQLLRNAQLLRGIPAVLIHGWLDMGSPPETAWRLAQLWPDAELVMVNGGHGTGPEYRPALIAATDRFRE